MLKAELQVFLKQTQARIIVNHSTCQQQGVWRWKENKKIIKKKKDYYKPVKVGIFYNYNYITYESNGDRNVNLSVKEYRDEIKPYLKNQIISKKSDLWKFN